MKTNEELRSRIKRLEGRITDLESNENQVSHTAPRIYNRDAEVDGLLRSLPGLIGYWKMNTTYYPGSTYEFLSGGAQNTDLAVSGTSVTRGTNNVGPGYQNGGGNGYLTRVSATPFNITGTESWIPTAQKGLTIGCLVQTRDVAPANNGGFLGKYNSSGDQRSYLTYYNAGLTPDKITFLVNGTGTSGGNRLVSSERALTQNEFIFVSCRYNAQDQAMHIRVNGETETNLTSIPSSIFVSTADFNIGTYSNSSTFRYDGLWLYAFLCASDISEQWDWELDLWEASKFAFDLDD